MFKEIRRGMDSGPCREDVDSIIGQYHEVVIRGPDQITFQTPTIIFEHGNWGTHKRFKNYLEYFAERGFLGIAATKRHHFPKNAADPRLGETSILDYVYDAELLIESLYRGKLVPGFSPRKPPILVGHSMGGLVAQVLATRFVGFSGLVLIGSAPPAGIRLHADKDYLRRVRKFAKLILGGKPYLPDRESLNLYVYNRMLESVPKENRDAMSLSLYNAAVYESGTSSREILAGSADSFIVRFLARCKSRPIAINENHIACPILILNGMEDRIIPWTVAWDLVCKYAARTNGAAENTELRTFSEFAHWPMSEPGWERSAKHILDWISWKVFPSAEQK